MERFAKATNLETMFTPMMAKVSVAGAIIGPIFEYFYGADSKRLDAIVLLFFIIVADWITGSRAAKKDGSYSSEYGISGIWRTLFVLGMPAFANLFDRAFDTPGLLFYATWLGLLYHNWQSLTANIIRCGWERWIPIKVMKNVSSEIQAKERRAKNRLKDEQ